MRGFCASGLYPVRMQWRDLQQPLCHREGTIRESEGQHREGRLGKHPRGLGDFAELLSLVDPGAILPGLPVTWDKLTFLRVKLIEVELFLLTAKYNLTDTHQVHVQPG